MAIKITLGLIVLFQAIGFSNVYAFKSSGVNVISKAIYGSDDRLDIYQAEAMYQDFSLSVAGMIPKTSMDKNFSKNEYTLKTKNLEDRRNYCEDVKFLKQSSSAKCSGFLVAPDVIVTAGHCVMQESSCREHYWVFDYKMKNSDEVNTNFKSGSVYNCEKVLDFKFDYGMGDDYAVIKLDREVEGRIPLSFRSNGKISNTEEVFVIGHPSGLPAKLANNAKVLENNADNYFKSSLDTFSGNSGSPVFNAKTGLVEGILVRGETDFVRDDENGRCLKEFKCEEDKCRGEDVIRITQIDYLYR
jgi:V8-like Glu-specific endopeptidase